VAALNLASIVRFVVVLGDMLSGDFSPLRLLLIVPLVATALTAAVVPFTVLAWRRHMWSLLGRIHYMILALAAVAFTWFVAEWNLLGFHF